MKMYMNNWYYIGGIIFCQSHVICIFISFFTMAQILMHGLMMNKKMGTIYNPGVATALFIMVPTGIYALHYIATHFDIPSWNWWVPICAFPFIAFLTILMPIRICQDRNSSYAFPERDVKGFEIKHRIAANRGVTKN